MGHRRFAVIHPYTIGHSNRAQSLKDRLGLSPAQWDTAVAVWHLLLGLLEAASLAVFWYVDSYEVKWGSSGTARPTWLTYEISHETFLAQAVISLLLLLAFLATAMLTAALRQHLLSVNCIVELCTTVPLMCLWIAQAFDAGNRKVYMPYFLRVWPLLTHISVVIEMMAPKYLQAPLIEILQLMAAILTSTGLFHLTENLLGKNVGGTTTINATTGAVVVSSSSSSTASCGKKGSVQELTVSFFASLYFTVVTFGTIGFGDVKPTNGISMLVVAFIIIYALYRFPSFFTRMGELIEAHDRTLEFDEKQGHAHVVVSGVLDTDMIAQVLDMFCRSGQLVRDVDGRTFRIVLLSPNEFSQHTQLLVNSPVFGGRVTLLRGNPQSLHDLARARVADALAHFYVCNSNLSSDEADTATLMQTRKHVLAAPEVPQYMTIRRSENAAVIKTRLGDNQRASVLERDKVLFAMLGAACVTPGAVPLLLSLSGSATKELYGKTRHPWCDMYEWSLESEVMRCVCPAPLVGKTFFQIADVFAEFEITLLGFEIEEEIAAAQADTTHADAKMQRIASVLASRQPKGGPTAATNYNAPGVGLRQMLGSPTNSENNDATTSNAFINNDSFDGNATLRSARHRDAVAAVGAVDASLREHSNSFRVAGSGAYGGFFDSDDSSSSSDDGSGSFGRKRNRQQQQQQQNDDNNDRDADFGAMGEEENEMFPSHNPDLAGRQTVTDRLQRASRTAVAQRLDKRRGTVRFQAGGLQAARATAAQQQQERRVTRKRILLNPKSRQQVADEDTRLLVVALSGAQVMGAIEQIEQNGEAIMETMEELYGTGGGDDGDEPPVDEDGNPIKRRPLDPERQAELNKRLAAAAFLETITGTRFRTRAQLHRSVGRDVTSPRAGTRGGGVGARSSELASGLGKLENAVSKMRATNQIGGGGAGGGAGGGGGGSQGKLAAALASAVAAAGGSNTRSRSAGVAGGGRSGGGSAASSSPADIPQLRIDGVAGGAAAGNARSGSPRAGGGAAASPSRRLTTTTDNNLLHPRRRSSTTPPISPNRQNRQQQHHHPQQFPNQQQQQQQNIRTPHDENATVVIPGFTPFVPHQATPEKLHQVLNDHVLLLDLHSACRADANASQHHTLDAERARARKLFSLVRTVMLSNPSRSVVLLARGRVHLAFGELWSTTNFPNPCHIDGCALNAHDLAESRPEDAKGVAIFSTHDGSIDEDFDTMAMLVSRSVDVLRGKKASAVADAVQAERVRQLQERAAQLALEEAEREQHLASLHAEASGGDYSSGGGGITPASVSNVPSRRSSTDLILLQQQGETNFENLASALAAAEEQQQRAEQDHRAGEVPAVTTVIAFTQPESIALLPPFAKPRSLLDEMAQVSSSYVPSFIAGRVLTSAMVESLLFYSFFSTSLLDVVYSMLSMEAGHSHLDAAMLKPAFSLMPIPAGTKTWRDVRRSVRQNFGFQAIALYRLIRAIRSEEDNNADASGLGGEDDDDGRDDTENMSSFMRAVKKSYSYRAKLVRQAGLRNLNDAERAARNSLRFVYLNPRLDTELVASDLVFFLH